MTESQHELQGDELEKKIEEIAEEIGQDKFDELIEITKKKEELSKEEKKKIRIESERKDLLSTITSGSYRNKKDKVAFLLNIFPQTRNSDVSLAIKYWEVFQGDVYSGGAIEIEQLFKLERLTTVARIRAKIQNEYGLFRAEEKIRRRRKKLEEDARDVLGTDIPSQPIIQIYADETGKTADNVIVGSVWFLEGIHTAKLYTEIETWKREKKWKREFHFTQMGRKDLPVYREFIDFLSDRAAYLSFKAISFNQSGSSRTIEDIVLNLYRHLILSGIQHEIVTGRVSLPRDLYLTIDEEDGIDDITLSDLKLKTQSQINSTHDGKIRVQNMDKADSKHSYFVQIADLVSGAINRKLNPTDGRNHKDELSEYIIEKLSLNLDFDDFCGEDAAVLLSL